MARNRISSRQLASIFAGLVIWHFTGCITGLVAYFLAEQWFFKDVIDVPD